VDCTKDLSRDTASRTTYDAPFFGTATIVTKNRYQPPQPAAAQEASFKSEIIDAIRLTEDKIRIVAKLTEAKLSNKQNLGALAYKPYETIIEKYMSKIRTLRHKKIDGTPAPEEDIENGMTTSGGALPLMEKCLN
jgi:hypothetical protein